MTTQADAVILKKSIQAKKEVERLCSLIPPGVEKDCPGDLTVFIGIAAGVPFETKTVTEDNKINIQISLTKPVAVKLTNNGFTLFKAG